MVPIGFFRNDGDDRTTKATDHDRFSYGDEMFPCPPAAEADRASSPTDFISRRRPANNESERDTAKRLRPTLALRRNPSGSDSSAISDSATGPLVSSPDSFSSLSTGNTTPVFRAPGMLPNMRNQNHAPFPTSTVPEISWGQFQDEPLVFPETQTSPPTPSFMSPGPSTQIASGDAAPFPADTTCCGGGYGYESHTHYTGHPASEHTITQAPFAGGGAVPRNGSHINRAPAMTSQTGIYQGQAFTNQPPAFYGAEREAQAQEQHSRLQRRAMGRYDSVIEHPLLGSEQQQERSFGSQADRNNYASHYDRAILAHIDRRTDPRPSPNSASVASLQNILHPVDQTPTLKHLDLPQTTINSTVVHPVPQDLFSRENDDTTDQAIGSIKTRRPRSAFPPDLRDETNLTRAIGACLRCRSQRVRCVSSAKGYEYPCKTCESVARSSRKVIHDFCCVRIRVGGPSGYRVGGLQLTARWKGVEICDVPPEANSRVEEIEVKIYYSGHDQNYDLCDTPARLRVCRFTPKKGDVLTRKWLRRCVGGNGTAVWRRTFVELPPYALEDIRQTGDEMAVYFAKNAVQAIVNTANHSQHIIRDHMLAAVRHYQSLPDGCVEKEFLHGFFLLWFYNRFTMGSAYISSENKLGCVPVEDPYYPLGNRISLPRMITAQFDSIMATRFIQPMSKKVNAKFEKFFLSGNPEYWFTLYVCTFITLAEVSFSCEDRRRHALENWFSKRYTVEKSVTNIKVGGMTALHHWRYYRTVDPSQEGWDVFCEIVNNRTIPRPKTFSRGKRNKKARLTVEQFGMISKYWQLMADYAVEMPIEPEHEAYENPLFFVSQMYPKGSKVRMPGKEFEARAQADSEEASSNEPSGLFLQGLSDDDATEEDLCSHNVVVTDVCFQCAQESP